jgi:outer membrane protein
VKALHDADAADLDIKVIEADFMPKFSIVGSAFTQTDVSGIYNRNIGAYVGGRLSVPIYEGGLTSSQVREAKEVAGQRRMDVDVARADVIALVRANWGALQAAKTQIAAAQSQIAAAERALYGVREEAKAGQRTTLDILNAQQELLNARIGLIYAQRERVVASYAVLAAMGRLSLDLLRIGDATYDPALHFEQVRDLWGGTTTPDAGR